MKYSKDIDTYYFLTPHQKKVLKMWERGLTQQEIAKKLGCHQTAIQKALNGNFDYNAGKKFGGIFKKLAKRNIVVIQKTKRVRLITDFEKERNIVTLYKMLRKRKQTVGGVYVIRCVKNNKVYVGATINLANRLEAHIGALRNNTRCCCPRLEIDWAKYGSSAFVVSVAYLTTDEKTLNIKELEYISKYKATDVLSGYNTENRGYVYVLKRKSV